MHCLVFTDTDMYSLTRGKAYLANQRWRRSTCLLDQCYDVGCHPPEAWMSCFNQAIHVLLMHSFLVVAFCLGPRSYRNPSLPLSDFPLDLAMLYNYVCKTLCQYCIPSCEMPECKTRNH